MNIEQKTVTTSRTIDSTFTFSSINDQLRIYINSKEDANSPVTTGSGPMGIPSTDCFLGSVDATNGTSMLNEYLSDIMMWQRTLQPSEIQSLYEAP